MQENRIIRTEFYFDKISLLDGKIITPSETAGIFPSVSIAWVPTGKLVELDNLEDFQALPWADIYKNFPKFNIENVLDLAVRDFGAERAAMSAEVANPDIVGFLLQQKIVVERSPPTGIELAKLIGHAPGAVVGAYIGIQMSGGNPFLCLLTVPLGVIVVGSALGVSTGLNKGLSKRIEKLVNPPVRKSAKLTVVKGTDLLDDAADKR